MTEAQPPRHVGRTDQVARQQDVQRIQSGDAGLLGDDDREVELERLPHQRAGLEQRPDGGRQGVELDRQRCDDRGGHGDVVRGRAVGRARLAAAGASQLLEVEGVSAAHHAQPVCAGRVGSARQERNRVGLRQRAELDALDDPAPFGRFQRRRQPPASLPRTPSERDDEPTRRRPAHDMCQHLDRGLVGPVQVVEHEEQPPSGRQPLEQAGEIGRAHV